MNSDSSRLNSKGIRLCMAASSKAISDFIQIEYASAQMGNSNAAYVWKYKLPKAYHAREVKTVLMDCGVE